VKPSENPMVPRGSVPPATPALASFFAAITAPFAACLSSPSVNTLSLNGVIRAERKKRVYIEEVGPLLL